MDKSWSIEVTSIIWLVYPKELISISIGKSLVVVIEKFPSKSEAEPFVDPKIKTFAPGMGEPSSLSTTFPLIVV